MVLRKLNYMLLRAIAIFEASTSFWNTVLCLKHVTVQWIGFDHVKLVIATYQWGLDLEPPSKMWQERLMTPGQCRNIYGTSPKRLFDLGLLVEKGTREVCRKTLDSSHALHIADSCMLL